MLVLSTSGPEPERPVGRGRQQRRARVRRPCPSAPPPEAKEQLGWQRTTLDKHESQVRGHDTE